MYSEKHFQVRMDPRPEGLWVVVAHPATGRELAKGPVESGAVHKAIQRLIAAIQRELVAPDALRIGIGLSVEGQFVCVEHVPTGRSRSALARGEQRQVQQQLVDGLLTELWEAGLLRPAGETSHE